MKTLMRFLLILVVLGGGFAAIAYSITKKQGASPTLASGVEATYRKLANGTIIYEERPAQGNIEEIEPAAGADGEPSAKVQYHYDPLTQTYRAGTVDSQGKSSQDIMRYPTKP